MSAREEKIFLLTKYLKVKHDWPNKIVIIDNTRMLSIIKNHIATDELITGLLLWKYGCTMNSVKINN